MRHLTPNLIYTNYERDTAIFTEMSIGGMGFQVINDTAYHAYNFYKIIPLTNNTKVLSATFYPGYSGDSTGLASVTLPQGVAIHGDFTSITLSAGSIIGYYMY